MDFTPQELQALEPHPALMEEVSGLKWRQLREGCYRAFLPDNERNLVLAKVRNDWILTGLGRVWGPDSLVWLLSCARRAVKQCSRQR